jgi:hypothetical protein
MKISNALFMTLAVTSLAACGNHFTPSPRMADAGPIAASPDAATLVFIRPSSYVGVWNPSVFIDGKYVADVEAERQVAVSVAPGDHLIFAGIHDFMTKACREMHAKVEAGKIYYVETTVANGSDLFAARPSDAGKLHEWLVRAPATRKLAGPSPSPMDDKEMQECSAKASEHFAGDDPDDKAKHVINAADGFAAVP